MERWYWITLVLCLFGIFKEFRPSEPFVTEFLIDYHNLTKETVVQQIYPIGTYSYLGTLPIVFLITDFSRYKPIIVLEGIAFVATYVLLIWGNGLNDLKVVQVLYGIASSTEVAYYTYIYAKVDREHYKKVTSYTYTAILVGNFLAAVVAQALVSWDWMNYRQLHLLTLGSVSIAFLISLVLPKVDKSIYFYRNENEGEGGQSSIQRLTTGERLKRAYYLLWIDCKKAYSNPYVVKWSVWWAIASAGFYQVINYIQPLYETVASYTENTIYNGAVDAVHTLLSALLAILVGHVTIQWKKWGEGLLCVISLLQGALLIWMSKTETIMVAYCGYVVCRTLYQVMITVASAEVAQGISDDSYGLIFGINRFIALSFQSLLTFAVADGKGFALGQRDQFMVYGVYFIALGGLFAVVVCVTLITYFCRQQSLTLNDQIPSNLDRRKESDTYSQNSVANL